MEHATPENQNSVRNVVVLGSKDIVFMSGPNIEVKTTSDAPERVQLKAVDGATEADVTAAMENLKTALAGENVTVLASRVDNFTGAPTAIVDVNPENIK